MYMCPIPNGFRDTALSLYRRAARHILTWVAKCIDVKNSVALVRKRTIPNERPPHVDEVSANFCGWKVSCGQRKRSPRPYFRFSRPESLLFLSSSPSILLTRLSEPRSRPTTSQKICSAGNRTRDLWICSQELWPLDHFRKCIILCKVYQLCHLNNIYRY
jgi:hypothetical protein